MTRYFIIGIFILTAGSSFGQQQKKEDIDLSRLDTLVKVKSPSLDSAKTKGRKKLSKAKKAKAKADAKTDTVRQVAGKAQHSLDKAEQKMNGSIDSLNRFPAQAIHSLDTLKPDLSRYTRKLDSAKSALSNKIDSLGKAGLSTGRYSQKLDSLKRLGPGDEIKNAQNKITSAQNKIDEKLKEPETKINEKLNTLSKEANGEGNLPGNVKLPGTDQVKLDNNLSQEVLKKPGMDNPLNGKTGEIKNDLSKNINGGINTDVKNNLEDKLKGDLNEKVDLKMSDKLKDNEIKNKINDVSESREVDKLKSGKEEINKVTGKVDGYSKDAKNIKEGKLEKVETLKEDLSGKVAPMQDVNGVQKEVNTMNEQLDKAKALKNKEEFKKQTIAKGREVVAQQLAAQQSQVADAVAKVSKYQKKAGTIFSSVKDLPKRPTRAKKPPLIERFVPGVTVQVQKGNTWLIDLNPTLRFRVRSVFSAGAGWNYRVVIDQSGKYKPEDYIQGFRSFVELSVRKGLCLRADVERMNAFVPLSHQQPDIGGRQWVWSYMAGLKKEFSFAPGVMGNVQMMYNIYDPHKESPYLSRFNVRFGFEFPISKKKGKSKD